jgi:small subunit ribosomal protein S2
VLFVGTKKQAQLTLAEQAMRSGQPYVAERYIGGMLTNFQTIRPRIQHFVDLAKAVEETPEEARSGREWFALNREYQKLRRNFAGLTEMERLPGAVFVIDPKREELMVKEANRLRIPVVALTDTNCDPEVVDYIVPGNDDAIRSINLVSKLVAEAILAGRGEEAPPSTDRPIPPAVEAALVSESVADQSKLTEEDEISASARASFTRESGTASTGGETFPPALQEPVATEEELRGGAEEIAPDGVGAEKIDIESSTDEPVVDEPVVDEPVVDEPVVDEPVVDEPVAEEPAGSEEAAGEPETSGEEEDAAQAGDDETEGSQG